MLAPPFLGGGTRALPADLVGQVVEIETQGGETFQATVLEVIERPRTHVLVRDSGKSSSA